MREAASGRAVERFGVRNVDRASWLLLEHRGLHPRGELELTGLRRGAHAVVVVPLQSGLLPSAVTRFEVADGAPRDVEVRLHAPETRTVQVGKADGSPAAGSKVELLEPGTRPVNAATWAVLLAPGAGPGHDLSVQARLLAKGVTAADGDVALPGPPEPPLAVRVSGGHRVTVVAGVRWKAAAGPLRVDVASGATVNGRLLPEATIAGYWQAEGRGAVDEAARAQWEGTLTPRIELSRSIDGRGESWPPLFTVGPALVARDGTFAVTGIPPGTWRVTLVRSVRHADGRSQFLEQHLGTVPDLRDGETRRFDAVLGRDLPALLSGTVSVDGQPLRAGSVHLHPVGNGGSRSATVRTNDNGEFDVQLTAGTWRMTVALAAYGTVLPVEGQLTLEPGQQRRDVFRIRTGGVRLCLVRADGTGIAGAVVLVELPGSGWHRWLPATDGDGNTQLDQLPLLKLRLRCRPAALADDAAWSSWRAAHAADWITGLVDLGEIDLQQAAGVVRVTVPRAAGY